MADPAQSDRSLRVTVARSWKRGTLKRAALWSGPPILTLVFLLIFVVVAPRLTNHLVQSDSQDVEGLQLKTLIREVKKELQEADLEATHNNEAALFELKEFDLDVNIVASGKTAQDAKVLAVGSDVEVNRERVQHIHLVWTAAAPVPLIVKPHLIKKKATDVVSVEQTGGPGQ